VNTDVYQEEITSMLDWIQHEYEVRFADYFKDVRSLFKRVQSEVRPITDEELSQILINLPMTLFDVSEKLNEVKVAHEVVKLKVKQQKAEYIKNSTAKTATAKEAEAELAVTESKIMQAVYHTIINRVENELTFAKELIMSAKKIWDGRRKTEQSNPVSVNNVPYSDSIASESSSVPVTKPNVPQYKTPIFGSEDKS
jgi:hypothetical protein